MRQNPFFNWRTPSLAAPLLACAATHSAATARPPRAWRPTAVVQQTSSANTTTNTSVARRSEAPRWRCDLAELALPAAQGALDVPSASIFADAVVGASLIVRERGARSPHGATTFDAELHFRGDEGAIDAHKTVLGLPMLGAPWRIEDARARVVRRCNAQSECEVFAIENAVLFPYRVREDAPVFSLRIDGPRPLLALAAVDGATFRGVARGGAAQTSAAFAARVPEGHSVAGMIVGDRGLSPIFRRERDQTLVDFDGAALALDDRPCAASVGEPFAVVVLPIALGTFGPAVELHAEIARDGGESTCVRRLYGRGAMRLVESSVDVPVRGPTPSNGMLRTPRTVQSLRCFASD